MTTLKGKILNSGFYIGLPIYWESFTACGCDSGGYCVYLKKVRHMKNRKNYLKARKKRLKWQQLCQHSDSSCPWCGQESVYWFERYDARCCITCNEWLDEPCGDPNCPFCSKRPQTPNEAYEMEDFEAESAGGRKDWRRKNYQHKADGLKRHIKRRNLQ